MRRHEPCSGRRAAASLHAKDGLLCPAPCTYNRPHLPRCSWAAFGRLFCSSRLYWIRWHGLVRSGNRVQRRVRKSPSRTLNETPCRRGCRRFLLHPKREGASSAGRPLFLLFRRSAGAAVKSVRRDRALDIFVQGSEGHLHVEVLPRRDDDPRLPVCDLIHGNDVRDVDSQPPHHHSWSLI